jgi:hypothetical protein
MVNEHRLRWAREDENMQAIWTRRRACLAALALLAAALPAASQVTFNEREVKSVPSKLDKADVWAFDFRFKDPRMIKVNIPGRGTRICWYLWYQVINRTGEPRNFNPKFELVIQDPPTVILDEVLPTVEAAIKRIEDGPGVQDIKNSVTIGLTQIPASKPADEAYPRAITGLAIWDASPAEPAKKRDRNDRDLGETARFSIYVLGLSNGHVVVDPPAPGLPPTIRWKTLQLNFKRLGDRFSVDSRDVNFVAPAEWIYRAGKTVSPDKAIDKMK